MSPLFKRDDKTTIAELEEYYANQKKTRRSKAWMMGILSFMITVGVITSLFFAGRWGYRELTNNDSDSNVATTQNGDNETPQENTQQDSNPEQVELPTFDSNSDDEQGVEFGDNATDNPDDLIVTEPSEEEGVVSDEAATITVEPDTDDNGIVAGEQTPSSAEIPNTGANEVIPILLVTAVAGYIFSRFRQISKN